MRTSITDPLLIAEIQPFQSYGKIGVTFCPGKVQLRSVSGPWARDLAIDLDEVARWNAAAVVTLIEEHEMRAIRVTGLGAEVAARHMSWVHLPIVDVSTPDDAFEAAWQTIGEEIRVLLRCGANVLLHCRGGLGRAGTIAARLLVELGWEAEAAIDAVRKVRPGAIETRAQEQHVRSILPMPEPRPDTSDTAQRDRALGAMLGLAVGDAVGTTLEFAARDSHPRLTDMVGGGPFRLEAGYWTDDTSLALALLDSLSANPLLDEGDLMQRFVRWHEEGEYSATGGCFDIGITTRQALARWKQTGNPVAGSTDPGTAGNGSLMRLAPVSIRHWQDRERLRDVAARQSRTTHGAPEAVDACVAYADILGDAIAGKPRSHMMQARAGDYTGAIATIMAGSWRGKRRKEIRSSGYVTHSLEAALWCVGRTASFEEAVLLAANLAEDADTTAAITGQLAGALYGASGIPERWRRKLAWEDRITRMAVHLFDAGLAASAGMAREDIATRSSWSDLQPLPGQYVTIPLDIRLDVRQAARVRQGFIPTMQDEKWFAFFENDVLYQHRSWSGICIDQVHFVPDGAGLRATHAEVNRDPDQYGASDDAADAERIREMVIGLADLPPGATSKAIDPMVAALEQALKPNYLGSPQVVRALLLPWVDAMIGLWRSRTDPSAPAVTTADKQAAESRLVLAFSGRDPAYTTMPWHSAEQLGRSLISAMGLDTSDCAGETLEFILLEAVAAFSIRANALMRYYVYAPDTDWQQDVEPKLLRLTQFFEATLLGTNSLSFPGLTIAGLD